MRPPFLFRAGLRHPRCARAHAGWPGDELLITSLGKTSALTKGDITKVEFLGHNEPLQFSRTTAGLSIKIPARITRPCEHACAFKITGLEL